MTVGSWSNETGGREWCASGPVALFREFGAMRCEKKVSPSSEIETICGACDAGRGIRNEVARTPWEVRGWKGSGASKEVSAPSSDTMVSSTVSSWSQAAQPATYPSKTETAASRRFPTSASTLIAARRVATSRSCAIRFNAAKSRWAPLAQAKKRRVAAASCGEILSAEVRSANAAGLIANVVGRLSAQHVGMRQRGRVDPAPPVGKFEGSDKIPTSQGLCCQDLKNLVMRLLASDQFIWHGAHQTVFVTIRRPPAMPIAITR